MNMNLCISWSLRKFVIVGVALYVFVGCKGKSDESFVYKKSFKFENSFTEYEPRIDSTSSVILNKFINVDFKFDKGLRMLASSIIAVPATIPSPANGLHIFDTEFHRDLLFEHYNFDNKDSAERRIQIWNVDFEGDVMLNFRPNHRVSIIASKSQFNGKLDFSGPFVSNREPKDVFDIAFGHWVAFKEAVNVTECKFYKSPNFRLVRFDSSFNFSGNFFFCDSLNFNKTYFRESPDLHFSTLPKHLALKNVRTRHWTSDLDLRTCKLSGYNAGNKCKFVFDYSADFNLSNLDASKLIIPSDKFEIQFGDHVSLDDQISIIGQIRDKCKSVDLIGSYIDWDILYKKTYNTFEWGAIGTVLSIVEGGLWNFGHAPIRLIFWLVLIFVSFWVVNYLHMERLFLTTYQDENLGRNFPKKIFVSSTPKPGLPFDTRAEKIAYSFLFTAVIYFGFKINHEAINYRNARGMAYVYFMYVAGTAHLALAFALLIK